MTYLITVIVLGLVGLIWLTVIVLGLVGLIWLAWMETPE